MAPNNFPRIIEKIQKVDRMIAAAECGDRAAIVQAMQVLVPEYQPANGGQERA